MIIVITGISFTAKPGTETMGKKPFTEYFCNCRGNCRE
jgi:hypothetical protein